MHSAKLTPPRFLLALLAAMSLSGNALTPVGLNPGEYDLTAQTALPHLEEALRYATTRTRQCLPALEAASLFPLLQHQAFSGCSLVPDTSANDGVNFRLQCKNPEAASGSAAIEVGASHISAILELKMGGKNMTLSQRVYGPRLGPCLASEAK